MAKKQRGFTIIEILISLAIGAIILTGTIQILVTIKQVWLRQQGLCIIQENARNLGVILGDAVRQAGNIGCNSLRNTLIFKIHSNIDPSYYGLYADQPITIFTNKTELPNIDLQSDVLWIKSIKKWASLVATTNDDESALQVINGQHLKENKIVAISDCENVDFLKVEIIKNKQHLTFLKYSNTKLTKNYQPGAQVGHVNSNLYYIANTQRLNENNRPIYALFRKNLNGQTQEISEGVEKIKVEFGVSQNGSITFLSHQLISDWSTVRKIRLHLLLNSIEDPIIQRWFHFEWPLLSYES